MVAEALHRGEKCKHSAEEAGYVLTMCLNAFSQLGNNGDMDLWYTRMSLAATARKLLWPHLQLLGTQDEDVGEQHRQGVLLTQGTAGHMYVPGRTDSFRTTLESRVVPRLANVLIVLDHWLSGTGCGPECCIHSRSRRSNSREADRKQQHKGLSWVIPQPTENDESSDECVTGAQPEAPIRTDEDVETLKQHHLMRQLQAVLLFTLAQICEQAHACKASVERHSCSTQLTEHFEKLVRDSIFLSRTELEAMGACLLDAAYLAGSESQLSSVFERHAVSYLDGRLLPGCCNLRCCNLDGVTEAALKTQLCGGCRHARYCSIGCQRAAWMEGKHSSVCSKH